MKIFKLINYLSLVIVIIISCNKNEKSQKTINIKPDTTISKINDSILFSSNITNLTIDSGLIMMNDSKLQRVIVINKDYNSKFILGKRGRGPKEFTHISGTPLLIENKFIYVFDQGKRKFKVFSAKNGKYKASFKYPIEDIILFDIDKGTNGHIFSSSHLTSKPIIKFDNTGNILQKFGKFLPSENEKHKKAINYRHIVTTNENKIITVFLSKPRIEIFNRDGKLLKQYIFKNYFNFFLQRVKNRIKKNPSKYKYAIHHLFEDTYYYKNKLYLLYWGDYNHPSANEVAVFKFHPRKNLLSFKKVFKLKTKSGKAHFTTIGIENNEIIAFDATSAQLLIYKL